jgi:hypothetical protein
MSPPLLCIQVAGALQLLIASVNFFAPRKFDYAGNLRKVSPIVREVFIVQNVYIVLFLSFFAVLCFLFAADLAGGSALGRALSGFFCLFWGLRLVLQFAFYDRELRRQNRVFDVLFLTTFAYLSAVFGWGAMGAWLAGS